MSTKRAHEEEPVERAGAGRVTRAPSATGQAHAPERGLLALQRGAGNQAVSALLAARRSARSGSLSSSGSPSARASGATRAATAPRYTTTDSGLANVAGMLSSTLGGKAASATGAVTFDSSAFRASVGKALAITKTGTTVELSAQTYSANGSVKATGPAAAVGNYEVGFLQTVYGSSRNFYYEPAGHSPGLLARIMPTVFDDRKSVSDTCSVLPVRDGDAGAVPWYGPETVVPFDAAATSTKATSMSDTPSSTQDWSVGSGANQQNLVRTDGKDRFRSWLAVKDKATASAIMLNWADWEVDYTTAVSFNSASPAASVVTPAATSGAKVTGTGDGSGGKWPLHTDPVANDVATIVNGNW